jgi:hypothetical protein
MCYIICMVRTSVYIVSSVHWGKRGVNFGCILRQFLGGFSAHGFLFPVKELGLLTNLGYWIRVLDAMRSYMYMVL